MIDLLEKYKPSPMLPNGYTFQFIPDEMIAEMVKIADERRLRNIFDMAQRIEICRKWHLKHKKRKGVWYAKK